jgi:hypothetical protein
MSFRSQQTLNLIGAITANIYMVLIIAVFITRIYDQIEIARQIGFASFFIIIPLVFLFLSGIGKNRRLVYFLWLGLMVLFLVFELIIDHILDLDFRDVQWATILYVMFFFGATGGMIGIASQAGKRWAIITSIVFLFMFALAFVQRSITGL